jgi:dTDP-4-dehydrorhamnose reductase
MSGCPVDERQLDELLSTPPQEVVDDVAALDGDLLVVGAGGKIGPTLAMMAARATTGSGRTVIAVSRFSDSAARQRLDDLGVRTIVADLLDPGAARALPEAPNILYLLGRKFGTSVAQPLTWEVNAAVASRLAARFAGARIVVYSTGNVYPLTPAVRGGATESDTVAPLGEYAQSCLARERLFEHAAQRDGTRVLLYRLNYAIDLRYGVLLEVARAVHDRRPVDVTMGAVNVIWQGDANAYALRALRLADVPARALNVTGPETVSIRWLAHAFGARFDIEPILCGEEAPTALLSNASQLHGRLGYPRVTLTEIVDWTSEWVARGGGGYDKPTHFAERDGQY